MNDDLDAVEETPQTTVTKEFVEDHIEDWKNRLRIFFQEICRWATDKGWRVDDTSTVGMHEELMQRFDVPAIRLPTLRLDSEHGYALFKPRGPWVIGANGRIDLYTSRGTFIIVDLAERSTTARWTIFRASRNRDGDLFTPEMITNLV